MAVLYRRQETMRSSDRWAHVAVIGLVVLLAGLAGGCAGGPGFPSISDQVQEAEIAFQRDASVAAVRAAVGIEERQRLALADLRKELARTAETLTSERATKATLAERLESIDQEHVSAREKLQSSQSEFAKLKETHEKLSRMAQETLEEVTGLRQRNESLQRDKQQISQNALNSEKRAARLAKDVDDLRAALLKGDATVAPQAPSPTAGAPVPVEEPPRPATSVDTSVEVAADIDSAPRSELSVQELLAGSWRILKIRYERARAGTIVWDALDITLVSVASAVVLGFLFGLGYLLRVRSLKRQLRQYRAYYAGQRAGRETDEAVAAVADGARPRVVEEEVAVAREARSSGKERQPTPEEFSPIFRSVGGSGRDAPAGVESEEEIAGNEDVIGSAQTLLSPGGGGKTSPPAAPGSRKVIGAWVGDGSASRAAASDDEPPPPRRPASTVVRRSGAPAAAGSTRPRPANPEPAERQAGSAAGGSARSNTAKSRRAVSKTEMISREELAAQQQAKAVPRERGTNEEQELLAELKSIIDKKFDKT